MTAMLLGAADFGAAVLAHAVQSVPPLWHRFRAWVAADLRALRADLPEMWRQDVGWGRLVAAGVLVAVVGVAIW